MDPIQGPAGPGPIQRPQPTETAKPDAASAFNEALAQPTSNADPANPAVNANTDTQVDRVREMQDQGLRIEDIRRGLVEDNLKAAFGANPPPDMVDFVTERITTDPVMAAMFNRIIAQAGANG